MATRPASENPFPEVLLSEVAAPAAAPSGKVRLYVKSDGLLYWKDDAGTEYAVGTGDLAAHLADTSDAHDASAVSIVDSGAYFTGTDVEAALQELGAGGGGGGGAPTDALYVVTSPNATLSAEIIIPGLRGSPDIRVAGANDQEFDSSTIGGTALGSPTTIDADTTVRSHLYIAKAAASGFSLQGRYWATPSTPFTMTAKLTDFTPTKANFMRTGLGIAEATPGKTEGIYVDGSAANGGSVISVISSTTPTTGAANVAAGNTADSIQQAPVYLRCVAASSTDVTWYFSYGGLVWRRVAAANRNPGFTIGAYYVSAHPENTTYDIAAAFDWIRFT